MPWEDKLRSLRESSLIPGEFSQMKPSSWMYLTSLGLELSLLADVLWGPHDREVTPRPEVAPGRDMEIRKFMP